MDNSKEQEQICDSEYTAFLAARRHLRIQQGIFTTCFFLLCLIDQLLSTAPGQLHSIILNGMGLVIAVIILNTDFPCKEKKLFVLPVYAFWALLFFYFARQKIELTFGPDVLHPFGWLTGYQDNPLTDSLELMEWLSFAANIFLYGFILIRIPAGYLLARKLPRINWPFLGLWGLLMASMIFSCNEAKWPLAFLLLFGCLYFTRYSHEEMDCLIDGMLDGIITAFFISLGFSYMFRIFDTIGYCGMYIQYQRNALFYLFAHAALLGKWYRFHKKEAAAIQKALAMLGSCFAFGCGVITTVKLVICLMILNTLLTLFLLFWTREHHRVLRTALRSAVVLLLCTLAVPVAFSLARYVPFYFASPLIYAGENRAAKVPFQANLQESRYTKYEAVQEELRGQFFQYEDPDKQENKVAQAMLQRAATKAYLLEIEFRGHSSEESSIWVTDQYLAQHSGQFFVHFAYTHGILCALLFFALCILVFCFLFMRCLDRRPDSWWYVTSLLFFFSALAYGCFERDWNVGQLPFTLLFFVFYLIIHRTVLPKEPETVQKGTPDDERIDTADMETI